MTHCAEHERDTILQRQGKAVSRAEIQAGFQPFGVLLSQGARQLSEAGIENARRESRLLMAHALEKSLEQLLTLSPHELVPAEEFLTVLARRVRREPMAFITGTQGFWTLDLAVSPATLIPRADSETVISCLLEYKSNHEAALAMLDLGTGSGCLLLAALSEYPNAWGVGVDINPQAASLARRNAIQCGMAGRASLVAGRWDAALQGQRFDVVLSNPPYIPTADLAGLMPEVQTYEPVAALDGGDDGMEAYRVLCNRLPHILAPQGIAIFEIGIGQQHGLQRVAEAAGVDVLEVRADLGGIARAVVLRSRAEEGA
ncbi:MAG: peptide chain release factor N(5)-glutamine methyltransferase [Acetobacter orientalis]